MTYWILIDGKHVGEYSNGGKVTPEEGRYLMKCFRSLYKIRNGKLSMRVVTASTDARWRRQVAA